MVNDPRGVDGLTILETESHGQRSGPRTSSPAFDPDDIAVLLFTSGTTGEPKAAVLRHRHLTSYVMSTVEFVAAAEEDATLVSVPPYHVAGISAVLSSTYAGRRIVYLAAFDPRAWVSRRHRRRSPTPWSCRRCSGRILDVLDAGGSGCRRSGPSRTAAA